MPAPFTRNRQDMERLIGEGASVMLPDGRIVTRVEDLPGEVDLAAGDRVRLEAERDRLKEVVDSHQTNLKAVEKKLAALPPEPKTKAPDDAPKTAARGDTKEDTTGKAAAKGATDTGSPK